MPQSEFGLASAGWWAAKKQIAVALQGANGRGLIAFQNQVANPNAQLGTTDIIATGPAIASSTDFALFPHNTASLKVTGSASITDKVEWDSQSVKHTVTPGAPFAFSVHVKSAVGTTVALSRLGISWYTSADVFISQTTGSNFTITSGNDWVRRTLEVTAPATAAFARPNWTEVSGLTSGKVIYFAGIMFNAGPLIPYFDGNTPGGSWDGGAGSEEIDTSNAAIKAVFANPPNGIGSDEWPCFIINPPSCTPERRMGGWRVKRYEVRITCLVSDAELEKANAWVDAFREAFIDAIDVNLRLNETVDIVDGPRVEEADTIFYNQRPFTGFDGFLTIRISDGITYES